MGKLQKKFRFESITFDNGSEFEHVFELESKFNLKTYFAKPASPYQQGSNENFKGLLRYYLPRKITQLAQEISLFDAIQAINSRPRKKLGWQFANGDVYAVLKNIMRMPQTLLACNHIVRNIPIFCLLLADTLCLVLSASA